MGYLQCICECINCGVNLLHPLSLQCHLLRLTPLHQTPLSTHTCISPAYPRCCRTQLRCHSAPLHCTASTNLQVCSTIGSGCTSYLAKTLTDWCGSFVAKDHCFSFQQLLCISSHSLSFRHICMQQVSMHVISSIESATGSNAINTSNWVNIMYTVITTSMVSMATSLWWQNLVRHMQEEVIDHIWLVYLIEGQSNGLLLYVFEFFQEFH